MTPEQNRNGFPVEIKELKEDGLSDEPIKFASYTELDKFTHRQNGYIYEVVKRSKQGKRRRKYIISSPTFEHGRRAHGTYYVIAKINGEKVADKDDVRAFYLSHPSYQTAYMKLTAPPKKSKEQLHLEKLRRQKLLLEIDTKYGDIDKAEGSPELEELRKLIGAKV